MGKSWYDGTNFGKNVRFFRREVWFYDGSEGCKGGGEGDSGQGEDVALCDDPAGAGDGVSAQPADGLGAGRVPALFL